VSERARCRLYAITPPALGVAPFSEALKAALGGGDVACLQLRLKGASDAEVLAAGEALMPIAHAHDVAFLINDRPDLAAKLGADGAHIGQSDMGYADARAALGPDRIVGVTAHASRHLAMEAAESGADYVAFGAFYASRTKDPPTTADPEILTWWSELFEVPCVAIGGITAENAAPLIEAGADFLAVAGGIWDASEGPAAAVRAINDLIDRLC
jgi:thiamine-phosphate pyrophosphorylase